MSVKGVICNRSRSNKEPWKVDLWLPAQREDAFFVMSMSANEAFALAAELMSMADEAQRHTAKEAQQGGAA